MRLRNSKENIDYSSSETRDEVSRKDKPKFNEIQANFWGVVPFLMEWNMRKI